ncbi:MAG: carbohydrate kinase [Pseudomonadota bacterium]
MKRVVCFGEALIDFLNTGHFREGELSLNAFTQFPGGAPANAAVAVARLGGDAAFAGQVGNDQFGHFLLESLRLYGVDTSLAAVHPDAPTALAFVFLDDDGERSFSFRRDRTADIVMTQENVSPDWFRDRPIVHFCSNTLTDEHIAAVTEYVVDEARHADATLSFDVNLRHNLWASGKADVKRVNALVRRADLAKLSREELDYLCEGDELAYLESCFAAGLKVALVTDGAKDLQIHAGCKHRSVTPPRVEAVDTTGGGDAFIGAVLYGLATQDDIAAYLTDVDRLQRLVLSAAHCGAIAVTRQGAFPSFPTLDDVAENWRL